MTAPSATCELYVDDVRVPDTGINLESGRVTALSALKLAWGRDGQNEQPGPASCSFEILDPEGNDNVLDLLHVGSVVDVWAEGRIPSTGEGWNETVDDPTLDSWPLGDAIASLYAGVDPGVVGTMQLTVVEYGSGRSLQLVRTFPTGNSDAAIAIVPPRKFSPPATLPDAWDDIPQYDPTQDAWRVTADVLGPPGAKVQLQPGIFQSPYSTAWSGLSGLPQQTLDGGWRTITGSASASVTGWLGLRFVVTGVHWRWNQQPAALSWETASGSWDTATQVLVDNVRIERPQGQAYARRVLAFSGEVSDVTITPSGYDRGTRIMATAMDLGARLGNTVVGDDPWSVQTLQTRANRICTLAGITSSPQIRIDSPLGDYQVSYRDVDAQPAYGLLQDLAQTGGGVLWAATHAVTGPYLWIENPDDRAALREFSLSGNTIVITGTAEGASVISACDVLESGTAWRQDTSDVITVVAVTWLEQGVDDEGMITTTERTVTVTDSAALATYGTRRLSISTELINSTDATIMANHILAQARAVAWRLDGLTIDTAVIEDEIDSIDNASREIALLDLIDGTIRMGQAVVMIDMPSYAPRGSVSAVYVEGGSYEFRDGYWSLALTTTPSASQGQSAQWGQLDAAWRWDQWSTSIAWVDTFGVAP